jgi:hypothetical protein
VVRHACALWRRVFSLYKRSRPAVHDVLALAASLGLQTIESVAGRCGHEFIVRGSRESRLIPASRVAAALAIRAGEPPTGENGSPNGLYIRSRPDAESCSLRGKDSCKRYAAVIEVGGVAGAVGRLHALAARIRRLVVVVDLGVRV